MRILSALDHSEYAEIVVEHSLDQAAQHAGAELHFVTVVPADRDLAAARIWLDELVRDVLEAFGLEDSRVILHVSRGRPALTIASLATEIAADLLVIGRFHVPSESENILDLVECPTLVVGIEGHVLEPQCAACRQARKASNGEELFCADHHSDDRLANLTTRVPPSTTIASRLW
jgi:nucleotide-binding universal stress UspA family protein